MRGCLQNRMFTLLWTYIDIDGVKIQIPTNYYSILFNIVNGGIAAGSCVLLLLYDYYVDGIIED